MKFIDNFIKLPVSGGQFININAHCITLYRLTKDAGNTDCIRLFLSGGEDYYVYLSLNEFEEILSSVPHA